MERDVRKRTTEMRNSLSFREKQELLMAATVHRDIFNILDSAEIDPPCFLDVEEHLWHYWVILKQFYDQFQRLPELHECQVRLDACFTGEKGSIDQEIFDDIEAILTVIAEREDQDFIHMDMARDCVYRLLSDRNWRNVQAITSVHGKTPLAVRETLEEAARIAAKAESLSASGITSSFPAGYESEHITTNRIPYSEPIIDAYLDGGGAAGEIYLLLGASGSGKSMLTQQLSVSQALSQMEIWERSHCRHSLGIVYFVSYELTKEVIQHRALASAASIPFHVLHKRLPLSTSETLNDRDRAMFVSQLEHQMFVPGEQERKQYAERQLNTNWRIVDFSGLGNDGRMAGGGNIEEIQQRIDADILNMRRRRMRVHVAGIFIDYLGMMARRYCTLNNLDEVKYTRSILGSAPDKTRRFLSYHFQCPVFMAHQLNVKGNEMQPGVIPDKSLASECRTLTENCDFVFVIAKPTEDEQKLTRMNCQKARREGYLPPVTLQIQGKFTRMRDVGNLWLFDDYSKQFIKATEVNSEGRDQRDPRQVKTRTKGSDRVRVGRMIE